MWPIINRIAEDGQALSNLASSASRITLHVCSQIFYFTEFADDECNVIYSGHHNHLEGSPTVKAMVDLKSKGFTVFQILLERRKFLMLGWNIPYDFNDSDFEVSENLLSIYLDEYEDTPWDALKYLIAGINYGGKIS